MVSVYYKDFAAYASIDVGLVAVAALYVYIAPEAAGFGFLRWKL